MLRGFTLFDLVIILSGALAIGVMATAVLSEDKNNALVVGEVGRYERICIDGVEYLYLNTGYGKQLAGHFKPDGSLFLCEPPLREDN